MASSIITLNVTSQTSTSNSFIGSGNNNISIGYANTAIGSQSFATGQITTVTTGYSFIGGGISSHACRHGCKHLSTCVGNTNMKRHMIVEKYKNPDFIDEYGDKKWLNRYGEIIKVESRYGDVTIISETKGYANYSSGSVSFIGGGNICVGINSHAGGVLTSASSNYTFVGTGKVNTVSSNYASIVSVVNPVYGSVSFRGSGYINKTT